MLQPYLGTPLTREYPFIPSAAGDMYPASATSFIDKHPAHLGECHGQQFIIAGGCHLLINRDAQSQRINLESLATSLR
jgi:hypothetical protein